MIHILFADALSEIIGVLVVLVPLVLWVIGQIRGAAKQAGQPRGQQAAPRRQAQPAGRRRPPAAVPAGQAGQQADTLREQVEEFLRRSGRQQPANQGRPAPARPTSHPPEIELLPVEEPRAPRRRLAEPLRPARESANVPAPGKAVRSAALGTAGRAQPVRQSLSASGGGLSGYTPHLGERIIADDEQFDVQLKAKFDHRVGTLAAARVEPSTAVSASIGESPAAQIAEMLTSPEGVRQAIVLNEILRRPGDRW
jgi:hypothetical protein